MQNSIPPQDADFSLGSYVRVLLRGWWIIAITLVATLLAGVVFSLLQPHTWESEAVLSAQAPRYSWRLDTNFQTVTDDLRLDRRGDFSALLTDKTVGSDMARTVIDLLGAELPSEMRNPKELQKEIDVRSGSGRLVYLSTTAPSPALAQKLTGAWTRVWIDVTDAQFGQSADEAKFRDELVQAEAELQAANDELEAFQSRSGLALGMGGDLAALQDGSLAASMPILMQQLVMNNSSLADYKIALSRVSFLKDQVARVATGEIAFSALPLEILDTPLLITRDQLTRSKVDAMSGDSAALTEALSVEESSLATTVSQLEEETESIQTQYASLLQDQQRIIRRQGLADEAVKALQRKLTEIPIQQEVTGPPLAILSHADLPTSPATPNWLLNMAAAVLLGLLGGVIIVFGIEYLRPGA